jgi:hypothetical protein
MEDSALTLRGIFKKVNEAESITATKKSPMKSFFFAKEGEDA